MHAHLGAGENPHAKEAMEEARAGFSCGSPPPTEVLASFWLATGALAFVENDQSRMNAAFAAASLADPDMWVPAYGARLRGAYEAAVAERPTGAAVLSVEPYLRPGLRAYVDGTKQDLPATVDAGLHLFQVVEGGEAIYHDLVTVPSEGVTKLTWVPPAPKPEPEPEPVAVANPSGEPGRVRTRERKRLGWLYPAAITGVLGGASAGLAVAQNNAMRNATTADGIRAAYGRQVGFAAGGYTLLGTSLFCVIMQVEQE